MPEAIVRHSFDYGSLDQKTAHFVQQQTSEIKGLFKQTVENIIAIGLRLNQVKERLPHGQWLEWLAGEFSWTDRTARNYMQVAEQFKLENFSDYDIAASALYLLAAPSTAEEAREEAITRAQAGERITVAAARELRNKYFSSKEEPAAEPPLELAPQPEVQTQFKEESYPVLENQSSQLQPSLQRSSENQQPSQLPVQGPTQPAVQFLPQIKPTSAIPTPSKRRRAREQRAVVVAPKRVQPGEWWRLGKDHFLYCGDPLSEEFQRRLPQPVSFSLAFPPTNHWHLDYLSSKLSQALSSMVLNTVFVQDQDLSLFREGTEKFFQIYTEGGEVVVLSFLPDPAILTLIEQLECRFICADPDPKRCDAALIVWTTIGHTAEKMPTHRRGKRGSSTTLAL